MLKIRDGVLIVGAVGAVSVALINNHAQDAREKRQQQEIRALTEINIRAQEAAEQRRRQDIRDEQRRNDPNTISVAPDNPEAVARLHKRVADLRAAAAADNETNRVTGTPR